MQPPLYYLALAAIYLPASAVLALIVCGIWRRVTRPRNAYRIGRRRRLHLP